MRNLQDRVLEITAAKDITDVELTPGLSDCEGAKYLPNDSRIRFYTGKNTWSDFIEVRKSAKGVSVYAGGILNIIVESSNRLELIVTR